MSTSTIYLIGFTIICILLLIGAIVWYIYRYLNKIPSTQISTLPSTLIVSTQPSTLPSTIMNIGTTSNYTKPTTVITSNTGTHTLPPPPPINLVTRRNVLKSISELGLRNRAWSGISDSSLQSFLKTPKVTEEIVLLDLDSSTSEIVNMHKEHKLVISYSSVGSYEPKREYNKNKQFPIDAFGPKMGSWGEYWLDLNKIYNDPSLKTKIMTYYGELFKFIADKGFDGVEFDNADFAWNGSTKAKDTTWKNLVVTHLKTLVQMANNNGLMVFMKNGGFLYYDTDPTQGLQRIGELVDVCDGLITEQANGPNDSNEFYGLFTKRGKPWYNFEYENESKNCKTRFTETMTYFDTGNNGYKQCLSK